MKRLTIALMAALALAMLLPGCTSAAGNPTGTATSLAAAATPAETVAAKTEGEPFETANFSLIVPKGWEKMDVDGGVQLYKTSGEVVEVHFRGSNMSADEAKSQVESTASQYGGTTPQEVDFLGKKFWTTSFTSSANVPQVTYLTIEAGVMISVKAGGPGYEDNAEFKAILDSIVFK
jgi:hypothetical protein